MYATAMAAAAILAGGSAGDRRPPIQLAQADCIPSPTLMSFEVRPQPQASRQDRRPGQRLAVARCWRPVIR